MAARPDLLWAVAVGGAAFTLYLRTLAPGLVAVVDTPMFQFIGRVLGVPHNPGYPLYVLLTFPFSYLPIGSLPYRINLFSAILGAITVSLTYLIARRLGCRHIVSAAAALGMAFGHVFWSQSIIAEVYTLDSAIIAGMLLALLVWGQTGRPAWFFTSVALLAAGLGNHTTIVGFAPGMALYAVLTNRPFTLRRRTLVITTLILAAGVLQYGFIIIRSLQPGTYLESRATTVGQLVDVMSGSQFSNRLFAFEWRTVMFDRLPWLVGDILKPELTLPGLALALIGVLWLLRRRPADALLFLFGGLAVAGFALNYSIVDTPVFLIPTTFVLWTMAAVGAERTVTFVGQQRRWIAVAAAATMLALPVWQVARNFAMTDRSRDTAAATTFDRLFDVVPDRTAFVHEDFLVDRMVMFKLLGDRSAGERRIELASRNARVVRQRHEAGFSVFAFPRSARRLRYDALNFGFEPLPLIDGPVGDVLSRLPDGAIVAIAMPADHAERWAATHGTSLAAIGGPARADVPPRTSMVIIGVRGSSGAVVRTGTGDLLVDIAAGEPIGETGVRVPAAIEVRVEAGAATIRQGSRDLVRTLEGGVMVVWNPDGTIERNHAMQAAEDFRVPVLTNALSVYPLRGIWPSQALSGDDWTDLANSTRTGSTMVQVPPFATAIMYLGSRFPLAPRVIDQSSTRTSIEIAAFPGQDSSAFQRRLAADGLAGDRFQHATHIYRVAIGARGSEPVSVLTALGGIPTQTLGRVIFGRRPGPAAVFRIDTMGLLRTPDRSSEVLLMARDDQAQLTGDGWSAVDWDAFSAYRWMTRTEARLVLPIARRDAQRLRIQALLEEGSASKTVGLRVNGIELTSQALLTGWNAYEWSVPGGMPEPLANEVVVFVDQLSAPKGDIPARGIAVTELRALQSP